MKHTALAKMPTIKDNISNSCITKVIKWNTLLLQKCQQ